MGMLLNIIGGTSEDIGGVGKVRFLTDLIKPSSPSLLS